MSIYCDFTTQSSAAIVKTLGQRLDEIRLSRNLSRADLAAQSGVSTSTLARLAEGKSTSFDSFVRVMQALQLTDQLAALLPDPNIRPVERLDLNGRERRRASRRTKERNVSTWTWGDEEVSES